MYQIRLVCPLAELEGNLPFRCGANFRYIKSDAIDRVREFSGWIATVYLRWAT
jgi:hypothetical protein